jgi:hypothetical protein
MNSELPIQVDGEPWIQCAGEIVVLKSALKVKTIFHKFQSSKLDEDLIQFL